MKDVWVCEVALNDGLFMRRQICASREGASKWLRDCRKRSLVSWPDDTGSIERRESRAWYSDKCELFRIERATVAK